MTLVDLTRGLFTYLVRFRHQAGRPDAPPFAQVRGELLSRFEEMGDKVRGQPHLAGPYDMVLHALVSLADEVVASSDWEHAGQWASDGLTAKFFGQEDGNDGFFQRLRNLKKPPPDVLAIYYLCLALGYHGSYPPGDPELARLKTELLSSLPSRPSLESPAAHAAHADLRRAAISRAGVPLSAREASPGDRRAKTTTVLQAREERWRLMRPRNLGLAALGLVVVAAAWFGLRPVMNGHSSVRQPAAPTAPAPPVKAAPKPEPPLARTEAPPENAAPVTMARAVAEPPPEARPETKAPPPPAPIPEPEPKAKPAPPPPKVEEKAPPAPPAAPVQPAPAPPAQAAPAAPAVSATPPPAPAAGGFAVQAGLFVGPIQSERLAEGIRKLGYPAFILQREVGGKPRYMVLAGPFAQREAAEASLEPLKDKLRIQPYLTDPQEPGKRLP